MHFRALQQLMYLLHLSYLQVLTYYNKRHFYVHDKIVCVSAGSSQVQIKAAPPEISLHHGAIRCREANGHEAH